MHVLIVSSVHRTTGTATVAELLWLLQKLRPDVLFLEHPADRFSTFLDGTCGTLESAAVRHFRERNPVNLVPVDLPDSMSSLREAIDLLFDQVEAASPQFVNLRMHLDLQTARGGFAFMNSPMGFELQSAAQTAMRDAVIRLDSPSVTEAFALWTDANDRRETAMIDGIDSYALTSADRRGILLVGAAHAPTLSEKLQTRNSQVTWTFDWELENPFGNAGD